jgi:hypothetical protein
MLTPIKSGRYISIKSDGRFHEKVSKDTDGAVHREYELKDGTKGEKWELLYADIKDVLIKKVEFEDGDFGENVLTTFTDGENEVIWAEGVATNFGTDYLKKLPNILFSEKLTIKPYAFTDEKGKERRGVSIWQKSDKVADHFWDGKEKLNGFPVPPKPNDEMSKTDWKIHFLNVQNFLTEYAKKHVVPLFEKGIEYPEEELNPENIPF